MNIIDYLATVSLAAGILGLLYAFKERRASLTLAHFPTLQEQQLPALSVVIAAKDEERTIEAALDSLLSLDYPEIEIVFVDDRSTDRTLQLARATAQRHQRKERLKILQCRELPAGWLGKVHAQHLGVKRASHPLILLTDADVVFEPGSLKRAVSARELLRCDHLAVAPQIVTKGFWEPILVGYFIILFALRFRPSIVHRSKKQYVGIGAFNLLTRETLQACDYLKPLRLQVIDDVHLGRLVKSLGRTQYCVIAEDKIKVRWFEGLQGCIKGLEKNVYAGMGYRPQIAVLSLPIVLMPFLLLGLLLAGGHHFWALVFFLFQGLLGAVIPKSCRLPAWVGFFFPLSALVLTFTFARSAWLSEKQNGVQWRDTHYPLNELRQELRRFLKEDAPL